MILSCAYDKPKRVKPPKSDILVISRHWWAESAPKIKYIKKIQQTWELSDRSHNQSPQDNKKLLGILNLQNLPKNELF